MSVFLAKEDKTIQEHIIDILQNLKTLKENSYNLNLTPEEYIILKLCIIYHDLGKINSYFQSRIKKQIINYNIPNYPHNYLSTLFINKNLISNYLGLESYKLIFHIVAFHHDRELNISNINQQNIKEILTDLYTNIKKFNKYEILDNELLIDLKDIFKENYYEIIKLVSDDLEAEKILKDIKNIQNKNLLSKEINKKITKLLGLFLRLDHTASAKIPIELKPINKTEVVINILKDLKNTWQLSYCNLKDINQNILILSSTGLGKTEMTLLLSHKFKLFYTLPIRSSVDAIYKRFIKYFDIKNVGILHANSFNTLEYIIENYKKIDEEIDIYFEYNLAKNLSKNINVLTVDQIFPAYFKYYGFEKIYATLAYSKLVVDEIQAYSPLMLAIILNTLKEINELGGKYIVSTATFPNFLTEQNYISFDNFIQYIPNLSKHKIKLINEDLISDNKINECIKKKILSQNFQKILIICNTVVKSQEVYNQIIQNPEIRANFNNIILLHSRFIRKDRDRIENMVLDNSFKGILISTQVVEVSLDIDFDILFTELAPLDVIIQRIGRILRRYKFNLNKLIDQENVIIFTQNPSGKGVIYEKELLDNTVSILSELKDNSLISENLKLELINKYYSIDFLRCTKYYQKFRNYYDKIGSIFVDKKSQAHEIFRDIKNIDFIPLNVLNEYTNEFKELIYNNQDIKKQDFLKLIDFINDLSVSIPYNLLKRTLKNIATYKLGDILKYQNNININDKLYRFLNSFLVMDLNYNSAIGIDLKNINLINDTQDLWII